MKIARLNRVTCLMREDWFYDEMECLQGSSILRCYGYFEMEQLDEPAQSALRKLAREYPSEDDDRDINPALEKDKSIGPLHPLL